MIDLVEKIVAGACGLLLLLTFLAYVLIGVPSTSASEFLPATEKVDDAGPKGTPKAADQGPTPEETAILEKLALQRKPLAGERLTTEKRRVPEKTFEYISAQANWLPELNKAKSTPMAGSTKQSRCKIFDIQEGSLLQKLGIKENDVVELIEGQIIEFNDKSSTRYLDLFKGATKKLREGQPISVTITRNGRPVNLEFRL
jgi:hypothetical protein